MCAPIIIIIIIIISRRRQFYPIYDDEIVILSPTEKSQSIHYENSWKTNGIFFTLVSFAGYVYMNGDTGRLPTTGAVTAVAYPSQDTTIIENTMTLLGGGVHQHQPAPAAPTQTNQPTDYTTMNGAIGTTPPEIGGAGIGGGPAATPSTTDSYQPAQQPTVAAGDVIAGGVAIKSTIAAVTAVDGGGVGATATTTDGGNISSGESTGSGTGTDPNMPLEQLKQLLSHQLEYYFSRYVLLFLINYNYSQLS
jgi:hypothetical protein